jgi:hypothetical protein
MLPNFSRLTNTYPDMKVSHYRKVRQLIDKFHKLPHLRLATQNILLSTQADNMEDNMDIIKRALCH